MADQWEYLIVGLSWNGTNRKWDISEGEKPTYTTDSFTPVFKNIGEEGWELVNVTVASRTATNITGGDYAGMRGFEPTVVGTYFASIYRAFFKRRKS